jgi:hypothetical protein
MRQRPPLFVKWRQMREQIGLPMKAIAVKGAVVNYFLVVIDAL